MKIYKLAVFALLTAFLSSCNEARFDKIPGVYQDLIPQEIQGNYQFKGKDFKSQKFDSLNIEIGMNDIKFSDNNGSEVWSIHQNFQVHQLRNLYVFGRVDDDIKTLWNLMIVEPVNNGIKVYYVLDEGIKNSPETKLQRYLPFMDVNYNHDPIPNGALTTDGSAISPPNGGTNQYRFYTMNEEQFFAYYEKELKNKNYVLLNKASKEKNSKKDKRK